MADEEKLNKDRRAGPGKPRKPYVRHEWSQRHRADYRYKGQSKRMARKLFGVTKGKMESTEQREQTALVLRQSSDPRFRLLAKQAMDPLNKRTALTTLAERLAIDLHTFSREYSQLMKSEGMVRAASHLPEIIEQVAIDAKSREDRCRKCKGTGRVMEGKGEDAHEAECPSCQGDGTVHVLGDTDRLKLLFETFQLTGGKGLNVNLDLGDLTKPEGLADLAQSLAPILEGEIVKEGE